MILTECFYVEACLCELCVSSILGARAGLGKDTSQFFPQSLLDIILLIGGVVGIVISGAHAGCEMGLLLCSMAVTALSGSGSAPQLLG